MLIGRVGDCLCFIPRMISSQYVAKIKKLRQEKKRKERKRDGKEV